MIKLIESRKPRKEVLDEYDIDPFAVNRWVKNIEIIQIQIILKLNSLQKKRL